MEHSQHTQNLATTTTLNAAQPPAGRRKNTLSRKDPPAVCPSPPPFIAQSLSRSHAPSAQQKVMCSRGLAAVVAQGSHAETSSHALQLRTGI